MLRSTLISASAIAVLSASACAQETPTTEAQTTTEASIVDASQVQTRDEAKLFAESEFMQADLNADGKIDKSEFLAYASVHTPINDPALTPTDEMADAGEVAEAPKAEITADQAFAEISKGDEAISETEMVETRIAQFDEADADKDEKLNESERQQFASLTKPPATDAL